MSKKVSFFVLDLSSNPIVRASPLMFATQDLGYEVEAIGYLPAGGEVYLPYRNKHAYKTIETSRYRDIFLKARALAKLASGDIIYCCKPNLATLIPAAIASGFGYRKRLYLDVEDNELSTPQIPVVQGSGQKLKWLWLLRWNFFAHLILKCCRYRATVVSTKLQARYGGTLLLHGPDESSFDPSLDINSRTSCQEKFKIDPSKTSVIFAGMPQHHKGFDLLIDAVAITEETVLVLVGDENWADFKKAKGILGDRCLLTGFIKNSEMPQVLAAVDVVAVPQRENDFTACQIPAKLLEGMAMAKALVVTDVSDLAALIGAKGECRPRGWLAESAAASEIAVVLRDIVNRPEEAEVRGAEARLFYLANASRNAVAKKLTSIFSVESN